MLPHIMITGVNLPTDVKNDRNFYVVGWGDVALPELSTTIRGVALARRGNSWLALPPKAQGQRGMEEGGVVAWDWHSDFALEIRDELLAAYQRVTGREPPLPERGHDS